MRCCTHILQRGLAIALRRAEQAEGDDVVVRRVRPEGRHLHGVEVHGGRLPGGQCILQDQGFLTMLAAALGVAQLAPDSGQGIMEIGVAGIHRQAALQPGDRLFPAPQIDFAHTDGVDEMRLFGPDLVCLEHDLPDGAVVAGGPEHGAKEEIVARMGILPGRFDQRPLDADGRRDVALAIGVAGLEPDRPGLFLGQGCHRRLPRLPASREITRRSVL